MKALGDLNKEQREAVSFCDGPLLILAGAGSGKTRTITYRIAYLIKTMGVRPGEIFAVTFTNKAAKEMLARVEELLGHSAKGMWVSTFHSACARILREDIGLLGYPKNFNIMDSADSLSLIKSCMHDLGISDRLFSPREVAGKISSLKSTIVTPEDFEGSAQQFGFESKVAKIYPLYQERMKSSGVLDFDDLLMLTVQLLQKHKGALNKYHDIFRYIMVDEYQDTNAAQYKIIKLLAGKNRNVCVVGDDDQSIYGWRGADIRNILEFEKDYPEAKVIKLEQNYRSTQRILDAAWSLVCNNPGRRPKKLWTELGHGDKAEHVRVMDEEAEASCIAKEISRQAKEGRRLSDFAVLYRTNTQSRTIEEAFRREGIPYV
ncbi:MAG: ATP-dependent helicase, partial [Nitrospirota bacterium]